MRRAWLGMLVAGAACVAVARQPEKGDPTAEVTGTLVSVSARAGVRVKESGAAEPVYTVSANVGVTGGEDRCVITHGEFTEALDEDGTNLVVKPKRQPAMRQRAEFLFRSLGRGGRAQAQPSATLSRLPRRFSNLKGYAAGLVADRVVLTPAPLAMDEALEVVPGMTFRWTSVKVQERTATLAYEVRVTREKGERAGLEPVFGGLDIRTADGKPVSMTVPERSRGEEDAFVVTAKDFQVPLRGEKEPRISVRAYDGIRAVRVEFEARDVDVATGE